MTAPVLGSGSNLPPDYNRETAQTQMKKGGLDRSSPASKGAKLISDSLEIPFEMLENIQSNEAEPGRPFLPPLFHTRFVEEHQVEDLTRDYYLSLRNSLPPLLKEKLEKDEKLGFTDRDPDLVTLDKSLKFEAHLLALADTLSIPNSADEKMLIRAQNYMALPTMVQKELLTYGSSISQFLNDYLSKTGRNDPSFEILFHISNQMKESLELLSTTVVIND